MHVYTINIALLGTGLNTDLKYVDTMGIRNFTYLQMFFLMRSADRKAQRRIFTNEKDV